MCFLLVTPYYSWDRAYTSDSAQVQAGRCSMAVRILLVDDRNRRARTPLPIVVKPQVPCVWGGINGVEAVEKAKSLRLDLILRDISMARMNGIEATRIIRREVPESAAILISQNDPIIVSRASGGKRSERQGQSGF